MLEKELLGSWENTCRGRLEPTEFNQESKWKGELKWPKTIWRQQPSKGVAYLRYDPAAQAEYIEAV